MEICFIRPLRNGDSGRFIKCSTSPTLWVFDVGGKPVTISVAAPPNRLMTTGLAAISLAANQWTIIPHPPKSAVSRSKTSKETLILGTADSSARHCAIDRRLAGPAVVRQTRAWRTTRQFAGDRGPNNGVASQVHECRNTLQDLSALSRTLRLLSKPPSSALPQPCRGLAPSRCGAIRAVRRVAVETLSAREPGRGPAAPV